MGHGVVDLASSRDIRIALSLEYAVESQLYNLSVRWHHNDSASISAESLTRVKKCGSVGRQEAWIVTVRTSVLCGVQKSAACVGRSSLGLSTWFLGVRQCSVYAREP